MESIMSAEKECLLCGTKVGLHKHHIFFGTANREISEEYGCWCWLCYYHHNGSSDGVHFNKEFDKRLKKATQLKFMERYPDKDFIKIFGRSYL